MRPAKAVVVTERDGAVASVSDVLDAPEAEALRDWLNAKGEGPARVVEPEESGSRTSRKAPRGSRSSIASSSLHRSDEGAIGRTRCPSGNARAPSSD